MTVAPKENDTMEIEHVAINKIAAALAKAQQEFKPINKTKTAKAGTYSYKYADLADVLDCVLPALNKNNIALSQPTLIVDNSIFVRTRLIHGESGQVLESDYPVCSIHGDHQKMGSAMTYARRYGLCSALGVAPDEDTDGRDAATVVKGEKPINSDPIARGQKMKTKAELHKDIQANLAKCLLESECDEVWDWYRRNWQERVKSEQFDYGVQELIDARKVDIRANEALDGAPPSNGSADDYAAASGR